MKICVRVSRSEMMAICKYENLDYMDDRETFNTKFERLNDHEVGEYKRSNLHREDKINNGYTVRAWYMIFEDSNVMYDKLVEYKKNKILKNKKNRKVKWYL